MLQEVHVTDAENIDSVLSFDHITDIAQIGVESQVNERASKTALYLESSPSNLKLA